MFYLSLWHMMILKRIYLVLLAITLCTAAHAEVRRKKPLKKEAETSELSYTEEINKLIDYGKELLGKRYRSRGPGGITLDCSGFVSYVFSKLDISLPRSSRAMSSYTQPIQQSDIKPGDLLYFRGRNRRGGVGHVAMVVDVDGDDIKMIHSSTSRGVIIESYKRSAYFACRYLGAGRVTALQKLFQSKSQKTDEE